MTEIKIHRKINKKCRNLAIGALVTSRAAFNFEQLKNEVILLLTLDGVNSRVK